MQRHVAARMSSVIQVSSRAAHARITASNAVSMRTSNRACRTTRVSREGAWNVVERQDAARIGREPLDAPATTGAHREPAERSRPAGAGPGRLSAWRGNAWEPDATIPADGFHRERDRIAAAHGQRPGHRGGDHDAVVGVLRRPQPLGARRVDSLLAYRASGRLPAQRPAVRPVRLLGRGRGQRRSLLAREAVAKAGRVAPYLIVGAACVLSLGVELFQVYCHGRLPTMTDVVANVAGAWLGTMFLTASRRSFRAAVARHLEVADAADRVGGLGRLPPSPGGFGAPIGEASLPSTRTVPSQYVTFVDRRVRSSCASTAALHGEREAGLRHAARPTRPDRSRRSRATATCVLASP